MWAGNGDARDTQAQALPTTLRKVFMDSISTYRLAYDKCIVGFILPAPGKMCCQSLFGPHSASRKTISERFIRYWQSFISACPNSDLVNQHD